MFKVAWCLIPFILSYSTYCIEHTRLSQITKTKSTIGSFIPLESTEILSQSLAHHVKIEVKPQSTTKITPFDDDEEIDVVTPTLDPFIDVNAAEINNRGKNILDFASDSSSDDDSHPTTLANTWRAHELDNSDNESVDSDEDPLKHAGAYTVDEVVTISKEKMQQLQSLYIDQFQRLQYVLREKRRQYLLDLKKEKETYSNIHDQYKDSPRERKLYKNLKAMNRYHKRHGAEALLHRQFLEKKLKQAEPTVMAAPLVQPQKSSFPKCFFSEGGVKCQDRSLPCCRFCRKHILEDKKQILFKACGVEKSGIVCQEPVQNIFEDSMCVLHTAMPNPKVYVKRKYESETEEEEFEVPVKKENLTVDSHDDTQDLKIEPTSTDEVIVE
jgi:KAT8 regulatory NSL complex subunit 2